MKVFPRNCRVAVDSSVQCRVIGASDLAKVSTPASPRSIGGLEGLFSETKAKDSNICIVCCSHELMSGGSGEMLKLCVIC
jgi:hypothetical protein